MGYMFVLLVCLSSCVYQDPSWQVFLISVEQWIIPTWWRPNHLPVCPFVGWYATSMLPNVGFQNGAFWFNSCTFFGLRWSDDEMFSVFSGWKIFGSWYFSWGWQSQWWCLCHGFDHSILLRVVKQLCFYPRWNPGIHSLLDPQIFPWVYWCSIVLWIVNLFWVAELHCLGWVVWVELFPWFPAVFQCCLLSFLPSCGNLGYFYFIHIGRRRQYL